MLTEETPQSAPVQFFRISIVLVPATAGKLAGVVLYVVKPDPLSYLYSMVHVPVPPPLSVTLIKDNS